MNTVSIDRSVEKGETAKRGIVEEINRRTVLGLVSEVMRGGRVRATHEAGLCFLLNGSIKKEKPKISPRLLDVDKRTHPIGQIYLSTWRASPLRIFNF